jgi:hypothetical protein
MTYESDPQAVRSSPTPEGWSYERVLEEIRGKTEMIAAVERGLGPLDEGERERVLEVLRCHRMQVIEHALRLVPMSRLSMDVGETIAGITAMRDVDCPENEP